jgi:O-6-methylguanine DNA methyltransferase
VEPIYISYLPTSTPLGRLTFGVTERGLALLAFDNSCGGVPREVRGMAQVKDDGRVAPYLRQVSEYLAGKRQDFDFELDLRGPEFHRRCWDQLLKIPFGETRSYGEIARSVGSPQAFRAVGQANHFNPVAVVVPCHRVLAGGKKLGGYGGGLPAKEWLLQLEGATWKGDSRQTKLSSQSSVISCQ